MFGALYHAILYQPLFNLLVFFYNIVPIKDVGIAIILLTILIKLILFPVTLLSIKNQKVLQALQPKLEALKKKHKDNKEELARATMELYKSEQVNPLSSCFPLLIQLPFLIAVYQVLRVGLTTQDLSVLYPFISNPGTIQTVSFGFIDWSAAKTTACLVIAVLAGLCQYYQTKMFMRKPVELTMEGKLPKGSEDENLMAAVNKQMLYFMPILTVVIGYSLPAGLVLYWLATTVFTIAQQFYFLRKNGKEQVSVSSQ